MNKVRTEGKTRRMQRCMREELVSKRIANNLAEQIATCEDLLKALKAQKHKYDIEAMDWANLWYDAKKAPEDTRWEVTDCTK